MPSIIRRIRTRLPTYLSTVFGALIDISDAPFAVRHQRAKQKRKRIGLGCQHRQTCSKITSLMQRS
jgi:hypothetical protein